MLGLSRALGLEWRFKARSLTLGALTLTAQTLNPKIVDDRDSGV